jgi:hypothetical protein
VNLLAQKSLGQLMHGDYPTTELCTCGLQVSSRLRCRLHYRNTIAGLPHGEQFFFFEKIRFASQKLIFLFSKKTIKMTLNSLEVTKCCKKHFSFWSS